MARSNLRWLLLMLLATASAMHLAVIMDGNARWARQRSLPALAGHKAGVTALRTLVENAAAKHEVETLTVYAFSAENWGRPQVEVQALLSLIEFTLRAEASILAAKNVRLGFIGDLARLPDSLQTLCRELEARPIQSEADERLHFVMALSYGGRQQVAAAARHLCERVAAGELSADDVDEAMMATTLRSQHGGPPSDPDLILRTGGQQRLSNFLPFESAYTEIRTTDALWPDFGSDALDVALREYAETRRTYGVRSGASSSSHDDGPGT